MTDVRDILARDVMALVEETDKDVQSRLLRRILYNSWNLTPVEHREGFLTAVDVALPHGFITFEPRWPERRDQVLELAARHWGYIEGTLGGADNQFWKSFGKIIRMRKRITDKQAEWAKAIYLKWKADREAIDKGASG